MNERFERTCRLIGEGALQKLQESSVCVFGAGGVGSYVIEALARSAVGAITVVDGDCIAESNINRQIIATTDTVGKRKALVAAERIKSINPSCRAVAVDLFYTAENDGGIDFCAFDYVVDAIDTVSSKLLIIKKAYEAHTAVISSMGTGNKTNPSLFKIADISQTSVCPLARVMRREVKKLGIERLKVLYSEEKPHCVRTQTEGGRCAVPASISYVPSVAGLLIAGEVINDLTKGC